MTETLIGLALMLATAVLFFILFESGLRLLNPQPLFESTSVTSGYSTILQFSDQFGWEYKPGKTATVLTSEYRINVSINDAGFRDVQHSISKPDGITRILVLGDSMMFGHGVPHEKIMSSVLQDLLGVSFEVINMGVTGYGTDQALLTLQSKGLAYSPDIVLLAFHLNDILNNNNEIQYRHEKPTFHVVDDELELVNKTLSHKEFEDAEKTVLERVDLFLGRHLHMYILVRNSVVFEFLNSLRFKKSPDAHGAPIPYVYVSFKNITADMSAEFDLSFRLINQVKKVAEDNNARFIFMPSVSKYLADEAKFKETINYYQLEEELFHDDGYRALNQFSKKNKVTYYDILPDFREQHAEGKKLFFDYDQHWNAQGHEVAAKGVYERLINELRTEWQ